MLNFIRRYSFTLRYVLFSVNFIDETITAIDLPRRKGLRDHSQSDQKPVSNV